MNHTADLHASVRATGLRSASAVVQVGFWSAVLATLWIVVADLTIAAGFLQVPVGLAPFVSSLLIAPPFLALVASIHIWAPAQKKIWSQIALAFATIYVTIVSVNYLLQLTVLRVQPDPRLTLPGSPQSVGFMFEILGYNWMVLAGLFLVPMFDDHGSQRWIRWLLIANAVATLVADFAYVLTADGMHLLVLADLGLWGLTFPIATGLIAAWFRQT